MQEESSNNQPTSEWNDGDKKCSMMVNKNHSEWYHYLQAENY